MYIGDKFGSGNGIWKEVIMVVSLNANENSPLVKLRAIAYKVNFYPLIDFVHLYIIKFFYTSFELQSF